MAEFIDREKLLTKIDELPCAGCTDIDCVNCIQLVIEEMLPENIDAIQHGHWRGSYNNWSCSVCGANAPTEGDYRQVKTDHCPCCGSRMDEELRLYRVYGHTPVTVAVDVTAYSEKEAYEKAAEELGSLMAFSGNGGLDKLVGVNEPNQSVSADEEIEYDDVEVLGPVNREDDDDYVDE